MKRLWERSAYLAQRNIDLKKHVTMLESLEPILSAWPAALSQIAAHADTLKPLGFDGCEVLIFAPARLGPYEREIHLCMSTIAFSVPEEDVVYPAERRLQRDCG